MDRTCSMGLWTNAYEYYQGAWVLVNSGDLRVMHPSYYLVAHSIELALKAFLRGSGFSLDDLKNSKKLGHDLDKILNNAISAGLETYIAVTERERLAIRVINDYYKNKELEYIVTGHKSYPKIELLMSFTDNLLRAIRQYCYDNMNKHVPS